MVCKTTGQRVGGGRKPRVWGYRLYTQAWNNATLLFYILSFCVCFCLRWGSCCWKEFKLIHSLILEMRETKSQRRKIIHPRWHCVTLSKWIRREKISEANDFTSMSLSFSICEMGMIIVYIYMVALRIHWANAFIYLVQYLKHTRYRKILTTTIIMMMKMQSVPVTS